MHGDELSWIDVGLVWLVASTAMLWLLQRERDE